MANTETEIEIDWTACELIERVPGKVSGRPVVRGTRIMPDPIVNSYELGDSIEEIHGGFPTLSTAQIKRLIDFAHDQRAQARPRNSCSTKTSTTDYVDILAHTRFSQPATRAGAGSRTASSWTQPKPMDSTFS